MLSLLKSLDGAIKLAVHHRLPGLAEKINSIKELKYQELNPEPILTAPKLNAIPVYDDAPFERSFDEDSQSVQLDEPAISNGFLMLI